MTSLFLESFKKEVVKAAEQMDAGFCFTDTVMDGVFWAAPFTSNIFKYLHEFLMGLLLEQRMINDKKRGT